MNSQPRMRTIATELILIALTTAAVAVVCASVDLSEQVASWARARERYQLDELPIVMLFLVSALVVFAWRRIEFYGPAG